MTKKSPAIIVGTDLAPNHKTGMDNELCNKENVEKRKSDTDRSIDFGSDLVTDTYIGSEDETEKESEVLHNHQEALRQRKMFTSRFSSEIFMLSHTTEVQQGNASYAQTNAETKVQKAFQMSFAP